MQFGIYFPPRRHFEMGTETSTETDLILLEYADKLGFDYAWFAENVLDNNQRPSKHRDCLLYTSDAADE